MDKHQALFEKVLKLARNDANVRVVEMNGSRVNPRIEPDDYQDFDIVFYVADPVAFLNDRSWTESFGPILLKQTSDDQNEPFDETGSAYLCMMQFVDNTRLDLTVIDVKEFRSPSHHDSLSQILMDKDGTNIQRKPDESTYYVEALTKVLFARSVNQFFWMVPYIAKGLVRGHLYYALKSLDILRVELERVLDWWIASCHDFRISVGKGKSRYEELLPERWLNLYSLSYASADKNHIRDALFHSLDLFENVAGTLSKTQRLNYSKHTMHKVRDFVEKHYSL